MTSLRDGAARRRLLQAGAAALALRDTRTGAAVTASGEACAPPWPGWQRFTQSFLQDSGRVLDPSTARAATVSEGQGYALFFALVGNDRARFERILRWTEDNLAAGDLSLRLPAWLWGRRDDGSYGVIDGNPASDADLWLAYALGEAGRLWRDRRYVALSSLLAERVLREETAPLPGLGPTLLPGARGFSPGPGKWRLNPSYAPLFLLRWLATRSADARWAQVLQSSLRVVRDSAPRGFAPDWAPYEATPGAVGGRFSFAGAAPADREGSYNAIRTYLWLGLSSPQEPERAALLQHFLPMADLIARAGAPPETVDILDGRTRGDGPVGFSAAVIPFLLALGRLDAARAQLARVRAEASRAKAYYYERALGLFVNAWQDGRFAFAADGSLVPQWLGCGGIGGAR